MTEDVTGEVDGVSRDTQVRVDLLVRSSSSERPAQSDSTVLEHVAPVGDGERERHLLLRDQKRHPRF